MRGGIIIVFSALDSGSIEQSGFEPWPGNTVLYCWARHFTLSKFNAGEPCDALTSHPRGGGGAGRFLVASWYRNRDKLWPDGPLGSYADITINELKTRSPKGNL